MFDALWLVNSNGDGFLLDDGVDFEFDGNDTVNVKEKVRKRQLGKNEPKCKQFVLVERGY